LVVIIISSRTGGTTVFYIEEVKIWLWRYQNLQDEIAFESQRLEELEEKAISLQSPLLSDMPKSQKVLNDRIGELVGRVEETEKALSEMLAESKKVYSEINIVIRKISCGKNTAMVKRVMQLRYLEGAEWDDICMNLFGGQEDFLEKEQSYLRKTFRYHADGMKEIVRILNEEQKG